MRKAEIVNQIADEIIIADNGSTDQTLKIAGENRGKADLKIINLPPVCPDVPPDTKPPGSFEWLRNESIQLATGDWILWIDADEELLESHSIPKFLESRCFDGFAIRQNHLEMDVPNHYDMPVRLFRNRCGFKFYGYIHEHAMKSLNEPIEPALELAETQIAHYGYVTEARRRAKSQLRNMDMLLLDRKRYPDRKLGQVLLAREFVNLIQWQIQDERIALTDEGALPEDARQARDDAVKVLQICHEYADGWTPQLKRTAWDTYQLALQYLGTFPNVEVVNNEGKIEKVFYQDFSDVTDYLNRFEEG